MFWCHWSLLFGTLVFTSTMMSPWGPTSPTSFEHVFGTAPDPECATFPATACTDNIGPCIGYYQAGPLQLDPCRYCCLPANPAAVCAECRCSAHLFLLDVRTHNPTAPGPSLVMRTGANLVSVVCSGISLCAWHSTGVSCRQPATDIRVRRSLLSSLCRQDYAAGAADSSCNSWWPRLLRWLQCGRGTVCQHRSGPPRRCCLFGSRQRSICFSCRTTDFWLLFTIVIFLHLICKVPL